MKDTTKEHNAFKLYIESNCELLTHPRCEDCGDIGEVYADGLAGKDYCYSCLCKDLRNDPEALEEYYK